MKLFYCHIPLGNFGDDLNAYLWPKLMPDAFTGTVLYQPKVKPKIALPSPDTTLFVGIGTLISSEIPETATKHVFGSGFGYGTLPPHDASWHYHCVRGPLTAEALGLDPQKAITDPAMLVRLLPRATPKKYNFSFVPHWEMALSGDWERVCRMLGINYIDPRWKPERVIDEIAATRTLITEALHGAIVADSLRVPWIPVSSEHTILKFKWQDWCGSVGLSYSPASVPTFWMPRPTVGGLINTAKGMRAAATLYSLMQFGAPILSRDSVIERVTDRLVSALEEFCRTYHFTLALPPQAHDIAGDAMPAQPVQ